MKSKSVTNLEELSDRAKRWIERRSVLLEEKLYNFVVNLRGYRLFHCTVKDPGTALMEM